MSESTNRNIDWKKIRAEYVTGNISVAKLAEKYGISESTLSKRCASEKWAEARKKSHKKQADKIAEKLESEEVKKTVRDIDKVITAANKLLAKINRAINEVDKAEYVSEKSKQEKVVSTGDGVENPLIAETITNVYMERKKYKTLINTKKISELSKSLLNIKEILEVQQNEDDDGTGIVFIPAIEAPEPPTDDSEEIIVQDE